MAAVAKAYGLDTERVLHGMSYANLILYASVLPRYDDVKGPSGAEKRRGNGKMNFGRFMQAMKQLKYEQ